MDLGNFPKVLELILSFLWSKKKNLLTALLIFY